MNILILTGNGREHALATAYAKSEKVKKVIMVPGNGLTQVGNEKIKNYADIDPLDFDALLIICKNESIDLVDVSQDEVIASGYVDRFQKHGITAFGPSQKASQIEWDKKWSRAFMKTYNLPIPNIAAFTSESEAIAYVESLPSQVLYVKAAGLAAGKGAIRAENKNEAMQAIQDMKQFGKAGKTFLIEECLLGEEFSLFAICDGKSYQIIGTAQDHKTVYDHNTGPNTGGMGCVTNPTIVTQAVLEEVKKTILDPFMDGMKKEGRAYTGILYLGAMVTKKGVMIIEFNARWGDPEAQVLLPSIETDYVDIITATLFQTLANISIKQDKKKRISIAACAYGYPDTYTDVKGKEIFGLEKVLQQKDISVFGAGIRQEKNRFFVNGGRIFHVVAKGETLFDARQKAYEAMGTVYIKGNNLHFRTDIGWQDLEKNSQ